jgi:hypothetical protein
VDRIVVADPQKRRHEYAATENVTEKVLVTWQSGRRFRAKVTGDSAASALLQFFTLVGHDQSTFRRRRAFWHRARCASNDFSLPTCNSQSTGTIVPGLIKGTSGQQLPGSPKDTVDATVTYDRRLAPGYDLDVSLNTTYSSRVQLYLSAAQSRYQTPPFGLPNLSASLRHNGWRVGAYVKNVADRRVALIPSVVNLNIHDQSLTTRELINPPREIGLRLGYSF